MHKTIKTQMERKLFKRSAIAACVMTAFAAQAHAQDNEDPAVLEEVVVYGVKQSLQNAQDIKRDADTFVDAISASDIGALPDRSVLEALQRIPGVSIERFASAEDPDHFSVEGSGVVIRGLTQTRSEFNGRDTFTANNGRGLSFQDVPPELMGAVEISKNQTADMVEGGISGTVNLKTRLPFDSDERVIGFSAEATYSDLSEETTPTGSLMYSDIWDTDAGKFGFLLNVAASNLKSRTDGIQVDNYVARTNINSSGQAGTSEDALYVPRGANIRTQEHDRDREGLAAALQWENPNETVVVTAQAIRSESTAAWIEHALEFQDADYEGSIYAANGSALTFNDDNYFTSGLLVADYGPDKYRFDQEGNPVGLTTTRGPIGQFGAKYAALTRSNENTNTVNDFGLNITFNPNDRLSVSIDGQYVDAEVENLDFTLMNGTFAALQLDTRGSTPNATFIDPFISNAANSPAGDDHFASNSSYFARSAMDHTEESSGNSSAFAIDADYELESKFFTSIEGGVRFSAREQENRWARYNWKSLSEAWSNFGEYGPAGQTDQGNAGPKWLDSSFGDRAEHEQYSFDNFHRGGVFGNEGQNFVFPSVALVQDYDRARQQLSEGPFSGSQWRPLPDRILENENGDPINADGTNCWSPDCYVPVATNNGYTNSEINTLTEDTKSAYIKMNFGSEDTEIRYSGNFGLRYVNIDSSTAGFTVFPDLTPDNPGDPKSDLPIADRNFGNKAVVAETADASYSTVLPSFNIKLGVTDDVIMRFALSKAIALPDLGKKRNYTVIDEDNVVEIDDDNSVVNFYKAEAGNPFLKPMEAVQYDMSFEWYFSDVGSLSATMFGKKLKNYFIDGAFPRQFTNNGATRTVEVTGAINGAKGDINGYEIAYQQFYDFLPGAWSGLGMQFNYTYVGNSGTPNSGLGNNPDGEDHSDFAFGNLPLQGLSKDTANIAVMYQLAPVEMRLAYNWRSEYLLTTRDVITKLPIFSDATGQLDGSIFFDVGEYFKIGLQATNLTNEETKTLMQVDNNGTKVGRSWFVNDRRFSFVVRGSF
ncbi:TonB-dependent receptor [Marinagarivorans algicola]|uniref:TonB-dependent receptor n=1 Tax=Marinagarivorans algicola TaxID=1513270 RepID=UPI0006B9FEBE|nr:TonB-dependent receptor [Marinagarivorans algicola]